MWAATAHALHHVNRMRSILAGGHDEHLVWMAHTGINGELLHEVAVVALRDAAVQGAAVFTATSDSMPCNKLC